MLVIASKRLPTWQDEAMFATDARHLGNLTIMATCPYCELDVSPNAQTCPKCGHSFFKDKLAESTETVKEGLTAAGILGFLFLYLGALVFGILFGLWKIVELENNPFRAPIDSVERQYLWLFFLVLPCLLLFIYSSYHAIKFWREYISERELDLIRSRENSGVDE